MLIKSKDDSVPREHTLVVDNRSTNIFYKEDAGRTEENGSDTFLTCPDGSLIAIQEVEFNRDDERLFS